MKRSGALLATILGLALVPGSAVARGPRFGVFGTINGKRMKAPSTGGPADTCVFGFYQATGGMVFTALECRGRRRRLPRRNFQQVVFACGVIDPPRTPPYEAACISAVYSEAHIGRNHAVTQKLWAGSVSFELGPDGVPIEHSSVRLRVDSFDGTYVRGAFFGVFDVPQQPGTPAQAPISGEVQFNFPVRGVN